MYEINLDLPAEQRWKILFDDYENELDTIKPILKSLIDTYTQNYSFIIKPLIKTYKFFKMIMYEKELSYFAKRLNIDFDYVLLLQLIYETSSCCTSIVSQVENKYCMFRTMDWPMEFLKFITVDLKFTKNGKTLYYATSWIGYIGILTAMIPDKCCISVNYRRTSDMTFQNLLKNVFNTMTMKYPIGYLVREICENETNIDIIKMRLCNTQLISPCYFTVCYNKKYPEIITRDPSSYKVHSHEYVIQTNCDNDKVEPNILYSVERRKLATKLIADVLNNFTSIKNMKDSLLVRPILNDETIYVTMMQLENDYYITDCNL